ADRRLAEGPAVGAELRQLLAGRVVAVDQRDHRPGRDVLDEARQQAAEDRRIRAYAAPKIAPFCTWSAKPMGRQSSPRVTSLPRISTSSYLESKRRWS